MDKNIIFSKAGILRRLLAIIYDLMIFLSLIMVFTLTIIILRGGREIPYSATWFTLVIIILHFYFFAWFWINGGQTLGMRAWKIKIVNKEGKPIDFSSALRRYLSSLSFLFPPGFCFIWYFIDKENIFLNDRLSKTIIIKLYK